MPNLISRFFAPETKSTTTEPATIATPDQWIEELFGARLAISGASITPQSAMTVPAVKAAVELIATTVGSLPCKVYSKQGGKQPDPEHPSYGLVHDDANAWTSASKLREQLTADALLHDNGGFAWANRVNGQVVELIRLDPSLVTIESDSATSEPSYVVREATSARRYSYTDIIHIEAPGGVAPIKHAREAIALALVLEQHTARLFGRGARPSGVLTVPGKLSADAAARIKASWQRAHGGSNTGGVAVLEEGTSFGTISLNAVDSQFEAMRRFQIEEISRAFRVAPIFLSEYGRATWSNGETMGQQFLSFTLLPWLRTWEAAYRRVLLNQADRAAFSIEFVVDDLLRADTATRAEAYAKFRAMGALTANEVRARENLPPIAGGDTLDNPYTSTGTTA